jgi:Transcriptional regulator containing an amidase domain and an AraC-type DNA-binding HTH domain
VTLSSDVRLGDLLVPVGRPSAAFYPPGASYGPREPDSFEFVWMIGGVAEWESGRLRHVLVPGTLLLVRPGMRDRFRWDSRRPTRLGYAQFGFAGDVGDTTGWPVVRVTGPEDPLRGLTRYLLWLGSRQPEHWSVRTRDVLALTLTLFVRGPLPGPTVGTVLPAVIDPILDHVRMAWSAGTLRPLSRTELARAGAMSPGHLSRIFREHCGVGVVAAFELLRLMRAEMLLRRSDLSVRAIAQVCGFADPYHFSHRFKTTYGVSPRNFRDGARVDRPDPGSLPGVCLLAQRLWGEPAPRSDTGR